MKPLLPATLKQLGQIATDQVGDCVGFRWERMPTRYRRLVTCYFRSRWAAQRFVQAARRQGCIAFGTPQWERLDVLGQPILQRYQAAHTWGWRVFALAIPDPQRRTGWQPAPPFRDQPGSQHISGARQAAGHAWWDHDLGEGAAAAHDHGADLGTATDMIVEIDDDGERDLDRVAAEVADWRRRGSS